MIHIAIYLHLHPQHLTNINISTYRLFLERIKNTKKQSAASVARPALGPSCLQQLPKGPTTSFAPPDRRRGTTRQYGTEQENQGNVDRMGIHKTYIITLVVRCKA